MELKVKNIDVSSIKTYEKNAKIHSYEQVSGIMNSIREFGFKQPIIVDADNVIVAGHGRFLAAKQLGLTEVPCVVADDLTEEQIKAFRLVDNKLNESPWDEGLLELELFDINDLDMSMFGFGGDELEDVEKKNDRESRFEQMQLKTFEHYDYDYVVFVFNNQMDWLNVVNEFGIKKVDAGYGKTKKVGVGRVIDGKRLLEKIRYQNIDSEPRESGIDYNT